jgi:hypothetical protein
MNTPLVDNLRSAAHDAGVTAGSVVTDLSHGAIDWVHGLDEDRVVDMTAPLVGGAIGAVSKLRRRLTVRSVLIALGVAAAGLTATAILRRVRTRGRDAADSVSSTTWTPSPAQTPSQRVS